jgi:hypothetical protein
MLTAWDSLHTSGFGFMKHPLISVQMSAYAHTVEIAPGVGDVCTAHDA